jgi:NTP pyrophosphatase (non-canonical NTP hydrolase)
MTAVAGEVGELANIIKKVRRGDFTLDEARNGIAGELADVQAYLDILAYRCGVDLGDATMAKWNDVSRRVGSPLRIDAHGVHNGTSL